LRAVEQQANRIEALESGRELPAKPAVPAHPTASIPQTPAPAITPRRPLRTTPQTPARPPRTRPAAPAQSVKPALMPPINIRPHLAPRSPQPPRDSSHLQNSVDP
jgi:hypothetical protein